MRGKNSLSKFRNKYLHRLLHTCPHNDEALGMAVAAPHGGTHGGTCVQRTRAPVDRRSMCTCLLKERFHLLISPFPLSLHMDFFGLLIWGSGVACLSFCPLQTHLFDVESVSVGRTVDGHSLKCSCVCRQLRTWVINLFIFGIYFRFSVDAYSTRVTIVHSGLICAEWFIGALHVVITLLAILLDFANARRVNWPIFNRLSDRIINVMDEYIEMNGKTWNIRTMKKLNNNDWYTFNTPICWVERFIMLQEKWQNDANDKAIKSQKFAAFRVVCVYFFESFQSNNRKRKKKWFI